MSVPIEKNWTIDQTLDPRAVREMTLDAVRAADELRMRYPKLQERYQEMHEQEESAAWLAKYRATWLAEHEALKHQRDALAEELREVYPPAARKIADLFIRIAANNRALDQLHLARPRSLTQHLRSAELHARELDGLSYNAQSLLTSVHLFDWENGCQICPPPQTSMAAAFAAMAMPGNGPRFTADWAKENERRAAGQRAEQQRMADYYARTTREQEERENREARERFAESQRKIWGG